MLDGDDSLVNKNDIYEVISILKNNPDTLFEQCIDLCGVDYLEYKNEYVGDRFAVVYHLLSVKNNCRIQLLHPKHKNLSF